MQERKFGPIRFIPGKNRGKYPYCHSVYIEGAGILIDPASDRERLKQLAAENGVREIWLSHWHEDHFMHLDLFEDVPLYISGIVYGRPREPRDFYTLTEGMIMQKHLGLLISNSIVIKEGARYRLRHK